MSRRVLIVDDEQLARVRLRDLLAEFDGLSVCGECANGNAAIEAVTSLAPEIVFLDVQMPGLDGFDVLAALDDTIEPLAMPQIIFVTAYDRYAIRAFEVSALDYLQKPVSRARLAKAIKRATDELDLRDAAHSARRPDDAPVASELPPAGGYVSRFIVKRRGVSEFLRAEDVDWIDGAGNYVRLHAKGVAHMLRMTMSDCEARLDPRQFVRVHRSAIVNLDRIVRIEPFTHGEHVIVVSDGARLRSSRAHGTRLRDLIRAGFG
jgi:two-component system LytT family response regulator